MFNHNLDLDTRIRQIRTKVIDESPTKLKSNQYPKPVPKLSVIPSDALTVKADNEVQSLALKLSKLVEIDCTLRTVRESFSQARSQDKWNHLKQELKSRNIYLSEEEMTKAVSLSSH